jgi:hypothetical protein
MSNSRFYEVRGYPPGRGANFDPRANGYTLFAGVLPETPPASAANKRARQKPASKAASSEHWSSQIPLTGKAMALADNRLFIAGTPVVFPADDLHKAYEGCMGGIVWAVSAHTGEKTAETELNAAPAWDGMAVANGRLYISLQDGSVACLGSR